MEVRSAGNRVSFDGAVVTIDRRGMNGTTTVEIAQILGVALEAPTTFSPGKLTITATGFRHVGGRVPKPLEVLFRKHDRPQMDVLYQAILAGVDAFRRQSLSVEAGVAAAVPVDSVPADTTLVGELARLAQLHASGALTAEEFTAAKARLIG